MSAPASNSKGVPYIVKLIVGLAMALGGFYVSVNKPIAALNDIQKSLSDMGLPLDLGATVGIMGVFFIIFPVIDIFFIKPLATAIDERNSELEKTFSEAEQLRADMANMKSEYERQLATTEANAREQIQAQIKEAQEFRKAIQAEAQSQADEYKQRAIAEIESEKQRVLTDLRVNVTTLSLMATERILGENMDNDRNRRLIDDFLATAEVKN